MTKINYKKLAEICFSCKKQNNHSVLSWEQQKQDKMYLSNDVNRLFKLAKLHKENKYFINCCYTVNGSNETFDIKEHPDCHDELRYVFVEYWQKKSNRFVYVIAGYGACYLFNSNKCPYYLEFLITKNDKKDNIK